MTMSSSLQLPSEDNLASLASVCSEPLLDHPPSSYQQSLRSRSAGPGATRNHEKENKSDNIIYPLEEQANQLEQPSDAWMQDEKEHSSSLTADLSRSHPDLRTIPLILTPLPDTRPRTAASVLNTRRNKVAPAAPAGTFHELRSLSPAPDFWVTGSGTSASQSPSHTSFTIPSSARWRCNRVYPSISATEVTSSDPRAAAGEISGDDSVFVEEATGEAVMSKQLSPRQSLGDGADSLIQTSSSDSDSSHVHVPYIPFHCAQEALTVVVNDMQSMKSQHIEIVEQILNAYNDIEQESKSQYRGFVLRLKEQHSSKVGAYKEVVKALQDELNNMSTHWEGTVKSISHRNRELLEENTVLYQKVKDVLEKTQEEKEKTAVYFTKRLDKEKAKHNKLMIRARETMVQFHHKAKKKLTLLKEDSQTHMSRERATHSQELQTLERELEQSRRQLAELTTNCDVTGASLTANKVAPVMAVVESSPVPVNAKTQHIESFAPEVAPVAATVEREATDRNVRSAQSLELQRPAGEAVPAAHSLIKISSSYLSISDDPGPMLPHDDGEPTDTSVIIAEEDKNDFIEFVDNTTVAKGTQEVGSDVDDFTVNKDTKEPIYRKELPADDESLDEEELTVAQVSILAGIEESVVAEPQDNAAATEEDKRAVVEHEEMETGDQPLQDEDEQLAVVTSNRGGASTGDTKPESTAAIQNGGHPRLQQEYRKLQKQVAELKKQHQKDLTQLKTLEKEAAHSGYKGTVGSTVEDKRELKKKEKEIKDAQKQCNIAKNNLTKIQSQLTSTETELSSLKKNHDRLSEEMRNKETELAKLSSAAKDGAAAIGKLGELQEVTKKQSEEIQKLVTSFNSERVLRKKYHNIIEDMKGKIRVYCRVRPLSSSERERKDRSVIDSPDEYSVHVRTTRTTKEYQFDQVFTAEHSQEKVFEDTKNLIQSAVDGYNVCLFAYGQTGSGKTYTMIGGKDSKGVLTSPGIAPRAFNEIYRILDANSEKFSFSVACYMLELYNDRLIDLFNPRGKEPAKLDIKKDKKGMVVVQGSISHPTDSSEQLLELFEKGSRNRHVSSTKMNAESSRSHLVIGVIIESTNKTNGSVHRGKLSIVDLAGSERASKTGATAEQLKEAQSINKSLSALGDVISALSSGQEFIPYRNNRLTLLMQDSLGGNAKTLMFVNISPADYNADETVTSLTYAARVKLISNDASKNAENREITRLKGIIAALKKGEELGEDDLEL